MTKDLTNLGEGSATPQHRGRCCVPQLMRCDRRHARLEGGTDHDGAHPRAAERAMWSCAVRALKAAIERIREMIQNVE